MTTFDKSAIDRDRPQYATRVAKGDVAKYVLLPGDPDRVARIANHLDNPHEIARNREFVTVTGTYQGLPRHLANPTRTSTSVPRHTIQVVEPSSDGILMRTLHRPTDRRVGRQPPQQRHALSRRERDIERSDRLSNRAVCTHTCRHHPAEHLLGLPPPRRQPNAANGRRHHKPPKQHRHILRIDLTGQSK